MLKSFPSLHGDFPDKSAYLDHLFPVHENLPVVFEIPSNFHPSSQTQHETKVHVLQTAYGYRFLAEQYYVDQMVKAAPEYEKDIREVMRRSDETIEKTDYAETWVRYLKDKGYHVYILSNYATDTLERTEDKLTFLKYVDGAVFSCQVKQIKPEPEIYKTLLGRYHLDPEKSVFLDDRAENCEAARKQGIHAIQFKSFKQAAAELEKLGVN